jgi:hemolysin III
MIELRDPVSSLSHLFTAVWALYATLILWRIAPPGRRLPAVVYGASMVLLFSASGVFHGVPFTRTESPREFRFFQQIDMSAVFLLIAGTMTPPFAIVLTGRARRWFLRVVWGLAAVGIGCLWLLPAAPLWVLVIVYLSMGWIGCLPAVTLTRALGWRAMNWVWLGAGLYTLGAVFELLEWPDLFAYPVRVGYHDILHVCDTAGSLAFFVFVVRYVLPYPPDEPAGRRRLRPKSAPVVSLPALAGRR